MKPLSEHSKNSQKVLSIRLPKETKRKFDQMKDDDPKILKKLRELIDNFVQDEWLNREGF